MARPRSFDEQGVLEAVRDQFWDAGYAATSLEDLMRVSGLGKGSLYAAFGDKHRLFLRALRLYADDTHAALRAAIATAPRGLDALRLIVMSPAADPTGAAARRGCLMVNSTCELVTSDPDVRAQAQQNFETMTSLIADGVTRSQREGDLPADADPTVLARALLAAMEGLTFLGRTGMDIDTLAATARSLADHLLPDPGKQARGRR
jgi:TetR/AcrR family transcriptional repressor of nem operon